MVQIGTIKVATDSGSVSLPVFNVSDIGTGVYDILRVGTPSGVGAIPLVEPADSAFPYVRIGTANHGVLCPHDDSSLFTLVDGFEDGNLSEYTTANNESISSSISYEGTYSVNINNVGGATGFVHAYIDDLGAGITSQGNEYRVFGRCDSITDTQLRFHWGTDPGSLPGSGYSLTLDGDSNLVILRYSGSILDSVSFSGSLLSTSSWYEFVVEWEVGGAMTGSIRREDTGDILGTVSATENTEVDGGLGMSIDSSGFSNAWFDNIGDNTI